MKYDLFYLKRIQKKMTDTVKINVFFYDIKICSIDFDFIYL